MQRDGDPTQIGFTSELGLAVERDGDALTGRAVASPELCVPEAAVLRPSVLLTWADILTGSLANEHTMQMSGGFAARHRWRRSLRSRPEGGRVCMTVDLGVRVVRPIPAGTEVHSVGRLLKVGRTITCGEAVFTVDGDTAPTAIVLSTFVGSPRPEDVSTSVVHGAAAPGRLPAAVSGSVTEMLGTRVVSAGVVEVARHPRILNWADTVQGGAVAACAEEAVLALDGAPVPSELEVRFLAAVRGGPMRASAARLGPWVRIEVVDVGNDGRLVAVAAARGA